MPSDTISSPEHDLVWTELAPPPLEVSSRAEAVDRARGLGLISPR
jgi:hypothetical protein